MTHKILLTRFLSQLDDCPCVVTGERPLPPAAYLPVVPVCLCVHACVYSMGWDFIVSVEKEFKLW